MKNKKNIKTLTLGIIIGGIIFGSIGIAASNLSASNIKYNDNGTEKTLQIKIEELYELASSAGSCPNGYACYSIAGSIINDPSLMPTGVKAIVYLDPTNLERECTASNSTSTTGTKTGCMKWYAYKEDSTTYTMILDHNTTAQVAYNTSGSNSAMGTTSGNIGYDLTQLTSTSHWTVTPRLISKDEVYEAAGNSESFKNSNYAWLFDYTASCSGCNHPDNSTYGYWTDSRDWDESDHVWVVYTNYISSVNANYTRLGLRPVIIVNKTDIS